MQKSQSAPRAAHSLEFFNGQILYRSLNGHGEEAKFVSPATVAAAFRNLPIDSGWLPPGVVRCGETPIGNFAVLFIPPQTHTLNFEGRKRPLLLNLPAFVFFGSHKSFYVWSTKLKEFQPKAQLYNAPLPNVFGDGLICWGQNRPPKASAATIAKAWELFIKSPFTDHAADHKCRTHDHDVRRLLVKIAGAKRRFPLQELISFARLDTTIDELLGGNVIAQ